MENKSNFSELLSKPLWQMTGEEYYELTQFALASSQNDDRESTPAGQKALGVHALAVELGCSDSTIYALMRAARKEDGSGWGKDPNEDDQQWVRRCLKKAQDLHVRPYRRHR